MPKGKYQLTAQKNGQHRQSYAQAAVYSGFSTAVVTGPDLSTGALVFHMLPLAAISGRVVDEYGEPLESALVQLIQSRIVSGVRHLRPQGWSYTNDKGEYRFGQLAGGSYHLVVTARPWFSDGDYRQPGTVSFSYAPVFYPNTTDPRSAVTLAIKPGEEAAADFSVRAVKGAAIHVTLQGDPGTKYRVALVFSAFDNVDSFNTTLDRNPGMIDIKGIPPGTYVLRAASLGNTNPTTALQTVEVNSADQEITLTPHSPAIVSGTVKIEDGNSEEMGRLLFSLRDEDTGRVFTRSVEPSGHFRFPLVAPGTYRAAITGTLGYYVRDVMVDGTEAPDNLLTISDSPLQLAVVASKGVGRVKGFVYREGNPLPGVVVVLAPMAGLKIGARGFQTDSDGSFDMQNVRPGAYLLFALETADFEYANPNIVKPYLKTAKTIQVDADSSYSERIDLP